MSRNPLKLMVVAIALSFSLGGCFIHTKDDRSPSSRSSAVKTKKAKPKKCRPSQYWDGHKCRHKGKGRGARKHDDR